MNNDEIQTVLRHSNSIINYFLRIIEPKRAT